MVENSSLIEFRIKRYFTDEPDIANMKILEVVTALRIMQIFQLGKIKLHIDLYNILKKLCTQNKEELLSIDDCLSLMDSVVLRMGGKLGTQMELKIEQSVLAASKTDLPLEDLIEIGRLFGMGCEGDVSFWTFYEDSVVANSGKLTDEQLLTALESL